MSQNLDVNKVSIERNKGIFLIAATVILSLALGGGLMKVGAGLASRASDGITVTGSAKVEATADNAVWTLSVNQSAPSVSSAVSNISIGVKSLTKYLNDGGISSNSITLGAVSTFANEEFVNGNSTGKILSYRANRDVTVRSKDVQLISKLSQGIGDLLQTGVPVNNYGPQYYISTLSNLRPKLLGAAMNDARVRAEAITSAVGGSVGAVLNVKSGPFQVTTQDSTQTADYGAYDTSTIEKTVTSTVSVTFKTK
jgi:hypothetical protein